MAKLVTVKTKGMVNLIKLAKTLPKNMREDILEANHNFTKLTRDSLKKELMATSKRFDNKIFNSIKANKESKFTSTVTIAREGIWLDSMKSHAVWLKRGRKIHKWAMSKGGNIAAIAKRQGFITVHKKPFIDKGLRRARKRLDTELRKGVRKAFRRSKK